jgi:ABC-2 type transport system permease protein
MLQGYVMQAMGDLVGQRFRDPTAMRNMVAEAREKMVADPDIPAPARQLLGTMMSSLDGFLDSLDEVMEQEAADGSTETESRMSGLQLANFESVDVTRPQKTDESGGSENLEDKLQSAWDITFPQATMWGILACAAGFAITMVRERTRGTMVRLQVAPITHTQIIAGKSLACMIGVLSVITFMLVLGYALGMRPRNFPLLIAAMLCIASCFVGMMMLMSVLGRTEEAVGGAAWGANVVMAMFGGGMIPLAFMPPFMLTLSHFSPVKWSVLALEGAIWRGFSLREILPSFLILLAIGVTGFIIGAWLLRRRAAAA